MSILELDKGSQFMAYLYFVSSNGEPTVSVAMTTHNNSMVTNGNHDNRNVRGDYFQQTATFLQDLVNVKVVCCPCNE